MHLHTVSRIVCALSLALVTATIGNTAPANKAFHSKPGRFSVVAPGTPTAQSKAVATAAGNVMLHTYIFDGGTQALIASYADYPEKTVREADLVAMLDGVRDGFIKNVQGSLIKEIKINYRTFPGREFRVETQSGLIMLARAYLVNNRLYQIVAGAPKDKFPEAEAKKFLNSFALAK